MVDVDFGTKRDGVTALYQAAQQGFVEVVRFLVEEGKADVDKATTDDGGTPLFMAAQKGNLEVIKLLLDKGADWTVGMRDNGWSPLFVASWAGKAAVVAELLERQAADPATATTSEHLGIPAGSTALSVADLKGHDYVVALLRRL